MNLAKGTYFEQKVLEMIQKYPVQLRRVGGRGDGGVDLRGSFQLTHGNPFDLLVQCKHEQRKPGPKYIRELEGVLSRESSRAIGLLASSNNWTTATRSQFQYSQYPLIGLVLNTAEWNIRHLWINLKLQKEIPGLVVANKSLELLEWSSCGPVFSKQN